MDDLEHVLWIGGPSASGKSAVAHKLARRHGLRLYSCDTRTWDHRDRAVAAGHTGVIRWSTMTPAERASVPASERREKYLSYDRVPMILHDLAGLPKRPLIVAEGTLLLPAVTGPGAHAVWLMPPALLRRVRLTERGYASDDLEFSLRMARTINQQVDDLGATMLPIDAETSLDKVLADVEVLFADRIAAGPTAQSIRERRALLQEANHAIIAQYKARSWFPRDPATIVKTFDCECAQPGCDATVERTIANFPASTEVQPAILAHGHALT